MQSCRAPVSWVRDRRRYRIPASPYIKYDARMTPPAPTLLPLAPATLDRLGRISTPTLTTQLFTLGFPVYALWKDAPAHVVRPLALDEHDPVGCAELDPRPLAPNDGEREGEEAE